MVNILPRVAARAFKGDAAAWQQPGGDGDNERKLIKRKAFRASAYPGHWQPQARAAIMSWCCEPLDHLWMLLQSPALGMLADLQIPGRNVSDECMSKCAGFLLGKRPCLPAFCPTRRQVLLLD